MNDLEAVSELKIRNPERIWGLTSSSIFFFLSDQAEEDRENTRFYEMVETLRTNDECDSDQVKQALWSISRELDLIDSEGEITERGAITLGSDDPESIVRALAIEAFPYLRQAIQDFARIDDDYMAREEFESFFPSDKAVEPLLVGSLGFAEVYPDSVEINKNVVKPLFEEIPDLSPESEEWLLFAWSVEARTGITDPEFLWDLYTELTGREEGRVHPDEREREVVLAHSSTTGTEYSNQDFQDALEQVKTEYADERDTIKSLMVDFREPSDPVGGKPKLPELGTLSKDEVKQFMDLSSVVNGADGSILLHHEYLTSRFGCGLYELYQAFEDLEETGFEASVTSDNLIEVVSAPMCEFDTGVQEDYFHFLLDRYNIIDQQVEQLSETDTSTVPDTDSMKLKMLERLDKNLVHPVYFTYTLLNPGRMGEEVMERYVGDSDGLHLEKVKLERWQEESPGSAKPYKEMQDKLLNKGLQENLDQDVVRIMTPYDDDTFREYASTLRDLARQGFEIRLLTRHTRDKYLWDRLKENLLEPLGEHRTNVNIRTYSRYKEHEHISKGDSTEYLEEFGIHGKLQTIGDSETGAVLLGSANFMENSFDWNPECGIYTENPIVAEAAITFFDFVWELAQADPVSFDQMKEVPDREFYPTYYQR